MKIIECDEDIPKSEPEVIEALKCKDPIITASLQGIARTKIKMGCTPLAAYQYALEAYLGMPHQ